MAQKMRIKLRSYDHRLVDRAARQIVTNLKGKVRGVIIAVPIPLPTEKKIFTVLRSPHVNKKSREQFQLATHKRLLEIYNPSPEVVDAFMKMDLPTGVDIDLKVLES